MRKKGVKVKRDKETIKGDEREMREKEIRYQLK